MSKTPRVANLINKHGYSTTRNGDKAVIVSDTKFAEEVFFLAKQLETELAEARADADHWKSECNALQRMVHEARAEIERLKLTTGELTGAFNARPKCEKCERKDQLIEQMKAEIERLKRCCNCEYANHKLEICEHPDNEPETFMDGVCDLWSHNI